MFSRNEQIKSTHSFGAQAILVVIGEKGDNISRFYDVKPNLTKLTVLNYLETNFNR